MLSKLDTKNADLCFMSWFKVFAISACVCFIISVYFYIQCIMPKFTKDGLKRKEYSIFYDVIKDFCCYNDYIKVCEKADDRLFNDEIVKEIYFNSCICSKKMRNFRAGLIFSLMSICMTIISAFVYHIAVI